MLDQTVLASKSVNAKAISDHLPATNCHAPSSETNKSPQKSPRFFFLFRFSFLPLFLNFHFNL